MELYDSMPDREEAVHKKQREDQQNIDMNSMCMNALIH